MTEDIMNFNTDLKELFTELKTDEMIALLDKESDAVVQEITLYNYDIIKKYYDTEKYSLLLQYIRFVAFSSFLCDYTTKRNLISNDEYKKMSELFEKILILKQQQ